VTQEQIDQLTDRMRRLEADKRALLQSSEEQRSEIARLRAENEAKDAAIAALQADAERYRWLRNTMKYRACADVLNNHMRSGWDAAIDAARAAREG
jgi:chromosome segregation ATPase